MSQTDTVEFILRSGGEIVRRAVSEAPIAVPDNLLAAINKDISLPIPKFMKIEHWGNMGVMLSGNLLHYCTVNASRIILRTGYEIIDKKEKIFTPNFGSSDPMMELTWVPPDEMAVLILMTIQQHKGDSFSVPKCWLYALDERGQYWKLPLSNIYEDGVICEGREIGKFPTLMEAVFDMLTVFDHSRWNRDLWQDKQSTQSMFRFQSVDDKFICLPPTEKKWTKLCTKIATDVQRNILL